MSAKGFMPGLFDRLIDRPGQAQTGTVPRVSLEEMKDSVARDLEALLNTRAVMPEEAFRRFPECARSIVAYGLHDSALSRMRAFHRRVRPARFRGPVAVEHRRPRLHLS
jgi:type VI secretion system protein ImpF